MPKSRNHVRLSVSVDDHEQVRFIAQTESNEPLFIASGRILLRECKRVFEHRNRLGKAHPMGAQVRVCLSRIPREPHDGSV